MNRPIAIAIDGPVAAGKTVVGTLLARRLGFRFLDTGSMYRAVTWAALQRGIGLDDDRALAKLAASVDIRVVPQELGEGIMVDGVEVTGHLRDPRVERGVSLVSKVSGVRTALVAQQRVIAAESPIVMAGRDIGTVVLPCAEVKVYLTASVNVRARRRRRELADRGEPIDCSVVIEELLRRDKIDSERSDSPLRPAEDAVHIDTDDVGVEELERRIACLVGRV